MPEKDYYSTREAAVLLGVAVSTIQLWSNGGILKAWRTAGGHRRIARDSVDEILNTKNKLITTDDQSQAQKIIIVEDNPQQIRLYKKQFLGLKLKTSVEIAEDGYQGLMKIGATIPDVIISDLVMPNIDGFKMIESIRKLPALDNTLIIVVSGLTKDEVKTKGGLGEDIHFFTKPVEFKKIELLLKKKTASSISIVAE